MAIAREPSLVRPQEVIPAETVPKGRATLIVILLTLAGAWLRLSHIGTRSLWLDEGATVALARASWQHFTWVWWHGEANLQTIYFLLMRAWVHMGISEAWLRLPSAIFGIASIPLMYELARKFVPAPAALAATALLAFSPTHVYFSQEARSYSLAILLVLISTSFFVRAVQFHRSGDWTWWTIIGVLSFYTHDFTALVLVAQAASFFFRRSPVPWRRLLVCGSVILLAAVPGLTYVFRASPENLHFTWMPRPSWKEIWHLAMFFGGSGIKIALALVLWVAGIVAIARKRGDRTSDDVWRGMLVLLWVAVPPVVLGFISLREPIFLERYMVFSLPATILLAAIGADKLRPGRVGLVIVIVLCGMSIPAIIGEYKKQPQDWRGASDAVLASAAPNDAVVFFPFYDRIMLDYYRDRLAAASPPLHVFAPEYYAGGEDVRNLLAALDRDRTQFRQVWVFISDHNGQLRNFDYGPATAAKLQALFGPPVLHRYAGVDVLQYVRPVVNAAP